MGNIQKNQNINQLKIKTMELVKCIIYRKSTHEIINYNYVVSSEQLPPYGLDPDLEVYAYNIPYPEPEFDARLMKLIVNSAITNTPHPAYPQVKQYLVTYSEEIRPNNELIIAVKNEEKAANQGIYNGYDMIELNTKGHVINSKRIKKETLEPWEIEVGQIMETIAAKIQNNFDIREQKIAAINSNQSFDIDAGWIKS